jgi:hypothetical protein
MQRASSAQKGPSVTYLHNIKKKQKEKKKKSDPNKRGRRKKGRKKERIQRKGIRSINNSAILTASRRDVNVGWC